MDFPDLIECVNGNSQVQKDFDDCVGYVRSAQKKTGPIYTAKLRWCVVVLIGVFLVNSKAGNIYI